MQSPGQQSQRKYPRPLQALHFLRSASSITHPRSYRPSACWPNARRMRGLGGLTVDGDMALFDQPLNSAARRCGPLLAEKGIESLPGMGVFDRQDFSTVRHWTSLQDSAIAGCRHETLKPVFIQGSAFWNPPFPPASPRIPLSTSPKKPAPRRCRCRYQRC